MEKCEGQIQGFDIHPTAAPERENKTKGNEVIWKKKKKKEAHFLS